MLNLREIYQINQSGGPPQLKLYVFKRDILSWQTKQRREAELQQEECYMLVRQCKGCTPDEQMLQLLLVSHINREQMATRVAGEREKVGASERR